MATTGTPRRSAPPAPRRSGSGPARPPARKAGRRRPKRSGFWQRLKLFLQLVTFFVLIVIIAGLVFLIIQMKQAPSAIDLSFSPPGRTEIFSSDGVLLADIYQYNRAVVPIERIPQNLRNATVAFEDKRFYEHQGVDFKGIARSLFQNIKSGDWKGEGGSTITQQLARNMKVDGLTRVKTVQRKLKEWIVANQIEKNYTKQDILWMYLNYVNYGSGAYGVQAAAQTYFGKDISKLDLAQCALLAGLPNRPSDLNPYHSKQAAKAQRTLVLQDMLQQHYITPAQFTQADAEPIRLASSHPPAQGSRVYHAHYFTDYVIQQLKDQYGEDAVMAGNMKVYTTLNMKMQQLAEQDLEQGIASHAGPEGPTQGCLVCLDPKTGAIKAMVGGINYQKSQFNIAADGRRQPGSSFKAVLYSAAIDSGAVTEYTTALDAPTSYPMGPGQPPYIPKDDGPYTYRRMSLKEAVAYSVNTIAVHVLHHIGPALEIEYARRLGVQSPLDPVLSLALGSSAVTPLEMAGVYETFPDGGNHAIPAAWTEVDDASGKHLIAPQVETHVLKRSTVAQLDDMLRAVVDDPRGTGHGVEGLVPDARGKTGTTQGHADVWFDGYTPNLVCVVWAGHPTRKVLKNGTVAYGYGEPMARYDWGATVCAPIWAQFMSQAEPVFLKAEAHAKAVGKLSKKPATKTAAPPAPAPPAATPAVSLASASRWSHRHYWQQRSAYTPTPATPPADANMGTSDQGSSQNAASSPLSAPMNSVSASSGSGNPAPVDTAPASVAPAHVTPVIASPPPAVPRRHREFTAPASSPVSAPTPPAQPQYVTVRINPEDGLLATKWDPEVVEKTFLRGTEPRRYSRLHPPPPGER